MQQWQFLIQKQGERAWLPLESGYAEIVEGRYRIVASSESANTDVEVRVTHQSPSEIPPRRRIHKRLRRTNSEGLTAVIPFTYFAPGVWEVRCSGDLMSDIFGTSWQHNLRLQVLPLIATTEITPAKNDTEGNVASLLPVPPPPFPYSSYETASLETPVETIISETISETISENTGLNLSSLDYAAAELETIASSTEFVNDTAKENIEVSTNNIDIVTEALLNTESENLSLDAQDTPDNQNEQNIVVTDTTDTTDTIDVIIDEPVSLSINSLVLLRNNEEIITDQPVNPVWVKGDTAEQILQNLIELALPDNDSLLEEEVTTSGQVEQPLPLLLILEEQSYVAQWGRTLTVRGRVKLRAEGELYKDDTSDFESVGLGELRVELRSPLGLEELVQQQQSVGEKLLPFGFEFSIEVPANCESKLILADIYFYGALSSVGDAILLANQSFTITADVAELLAVSATANEREPDMLDLAQPQLTPEPEKSVSIDLELFNLVKTAKKPLAPLVTQPSPKRALPPLVDASTSKAQTPSLSDSGNYASQLVSIVENSTSLPFLRKRQIPIEKETASNIEVEHTELSVEEPEIELPLLEQENLVEQENLEENSKSQTYINDAVEEKDIAFDITVENTEQNLDDYIVTNNQHQNFAQPKEEPQLIAIYNDAGTNNVPYVSPLIQKWMQTQGYSIPQTTNLGYQYNTAMAPINVPNYISTYNSTQNEITNNESSNIQHEETDLLESVTSSTHDTDIASVEVPVNVNTIEEKTPSNWIAQEIVVDDIDDNDNSTDNRDLELDEAPQQSVAEMLSSLPSLEDIELLPVPQINLPPKELVSGNTIRVRILLKEMRPNTGVKLWVEDCQTRWLLEGPHLLTDLQPNPFESGMEVITELNIPFGCVEIRIEAIAIDIITQLESDKASIQRTVVPPDLPVLQFDELLGI